MFVTQYFTILTFLAFPPSIISVLVLFPVNKPEKKPNE